MIKIEVYLFGCTASKSIGVARLALCLLTKCQSRVRPGPPKIDLLKYKQHSQSVIAPFCFSLISPFHHTSFSGPLNCLVSSTFLTSFLSGLV